MTMRSKISVFLVLTLLATTILGAASFGVGAAVGDSLSGKKALFVGDSIMAGWRDTAGGKSDYSNGGGWATRLQNNYGMTVKNAAVAGWALTTIRDWKGGNIRDQLSQNRYYDCDYIIIEGGFNDIFGDDNANGGLKQPVPKGTMTAANVFTSASFDVSTFAGAMEDTLCRATTYFSGKKIGFLVTYQTPYSERNQATKDTREYFALAMQICDKWGVPYLNFNTGTEPISGKSYTDLFYPNKRARADNFADDIHPNAAGYDMSTPFIAAWMETLKPVTAPAGADNGEGNQPTGKPNVRLISQNYNSFTPGNYSQNYGANNTAGVGGNGSGRNIIGGHSHSASGDDTTGKAVALIVNQSSSHKTVAQTCVVGDNKQYLKVQKGKLYEVSFWAYWNPDETAFKSVYESANANTANFSSTSALDMTFHFHTTNSSSANQPSMECECALDPISLPKKTWQKITATFMVQSTQAQSLYLNIGASFANASQTYYTYLYIDDVEVYVFDQNAVARGDLNADGRVDSDDLTELARVIAKISQPDQLINRVGDVNGDGKVDSDDLTKMAKYIAKIINTLDDEPTTTTTTQTTTTTTTGSTTPTSTSAQTTTTTDPFDNHENWIEVEI